MTETQPVEKKASGSAMRQQVLGAVGTLAAAIIIYFIYQSYCYVETDNAMVQAPATLLSAKVSGIIVRCDVEENQIVKAGQLLAEIKTDDYVNTLTQIQGEMEAYAAQLRGAESNYRRNLELHKKGASTQERLDSAEAEYRALERRLKSAQAQVAQAKLNLEYTQIKAPVDGKVGKKSFEVGMLAMPGQPLIGFVSSAERWVVANFKETEMAHIFEGKHAYVSVDAIPGTEYEGVVQSISPATGATFSLLPPDNATGNFTKVVQRVPVRIKLEGLSEKDIDRLQTGLSADVRVKIR